ncbi:unnamed protein product [Didymodactylos carnosus]|uniref:Cytosol aminopeptidase domain-containing protein n=1 Tax=Didymodactylos carnosus TaxID=1234261 RepID=A0A815RSI6_9BILA|nr:unnamed protein product [Didymodactylos carnosus]CAF1480887.1 unnamed protein product [Didymodactylos carnosus]CAF4151003.1 unnamed protein product [Didymodactylos carnosus]CAF4345987.1 unnamed protein product [Didymodactylos carnosus]
MGLIMSRRMFSEIITVKNLTSDVSSYDSLVIVASNLGQLEKYDTNIATVLKQFSEIYSPTGSLIRDYDDVRKFADATACGIKKALSIGSKRPLLACFCSTFPKAKLVTLLSALETTYVPLQIREDISDREQKIERLGFWCCDNNDEEKTVRYANAIELGRCVARDIGGGDPERMAPPKLADYVEKTFAHTTVKVKIIKDKNEFEKEFPCFAAVNRAASIVDRHNGRIIILEYTGEGTVDSTVLLVGKGITYDTGGLDIKAGGIMVGMSYDKCGAAAVAGFFKVLAELKPKGFKAIGVLAVTRNNCGEEGFVSDEIITTRGGARIRVGNTDAEETNPYLFTIATLTGHIVRAYGPNYTAILDNGPAKRDNMSQKFQQVGDLIGDPFEISTIRREDYDFIKDKGEVADILQCNNAASSATSRGHQFPAAFLIRVSGLDKHGIDSDQPLRYSHLDIAGSAGHLPNNPTGRPIPSLCEMFISPRI